MGNHTHFFITPKDPFCEKKFMKWTLQKLNEIQLLPSSNRDPNNCLNIDDIQTLTLVVGEWVDRGERERERFDHNVHQLYYVSLNSLRTPSHSVLMA